MKIKVLIFILLVFISSALNAQDLIVLKSGDSLNCLITMERSDYIYYSINEDFGIKKTLVSTSKVAEIKKYYFEGSDDQGVLAVKRRYREFSFYFSGGYSYLAAKVDDGLPDGFDEYYKKLKNGYHIGGELDYYFSRHYGFGAKFSMFKTNSEINNISVTYASGEMAYGSLEEHISTYYIAPSFLMRYLSKNNKNSLVMNFSVGYVSYTNDAILVFPLQITSSTVGLDLGIDYTYSLTDNFAIGARIALFTGSLKKITYESNGIKETVELNSSAYESLARFDCGFVMRFTI